MWASLHCYYTFMMLSRVSRLLFVLKSSKQFMALKGQRALTVFYERLPSETRAHYKSIVKNLKKLCGAESLLVVPSFSLKELSQRPFTDMQTLFRSQTKIYRYEISFWYNNVFTIVSDHGTILILESKINNT